MVHLWAAATIWFLCSMLVTIEMAMEPRATWNEYLICTRRAHRTRQLLLAFASAVLIGCYCPGGKCDYAFRPNYEARHRVFVEGLNSSIGRPFDQHTCLREGNCPPQTLGSGLVRYMLVDWRPWMKGCTFWYDVDPGTRIVKAVGYRGSDTECAVGPLQ